MTTYPQQVGSLALERCPHCSVAKPFLNQQSSFQTRDSAGAGLRTWALYVCTSCGGVTTTAVPEGWGQQIAEIFPTTQTIDDAIPERARSYLSQAVAALHAPAGAVMLAASAVDAMLKAKDYKSGNLNSRIEKAAKDHLITPEMAAWAHEVRLDANDQRHADDEGPLPDDADAKRAISFAQALAEFLFVLPARVAAGRTKPKV